MKVFFILVVIGLIEGQPVAKPVATYQTVKQCQDAFVVLGAAAYTQGVALAGACLVYKVPGSGTEG